jgi:hypothetical protein
MRVTKLADLQSRHFVEVLEDAFDHYVEANKIRFAKDLEQKASALESQARRLRQDGSTALL